MLAMMDELARLRGSVQDAHAAAAETRAMLAPEAAPPASATAVGLLLRAVKEMQDRIEALEERAKTDRETIVLLVDKVGTDDDIRTLGLKLRHHSDSQPLLDLSGLVQLRDSASSNSNLRLAVDEMRSSLPLIKHQENDMLLLRREMEHRFLEESARHVETGKKVDLLLREVGRWKD